MSGFDIGRIDDVIHGRMRLGIVAYLASAEVADFNELRNVLNATQGNLSVHLRKLEDAGYIAIEKRFVGRKPQTLAGGRKFWAVIIGNSTSWCAAFHRS